jgi:hypothetical protein
MTSGESVSSAVAIQRTAIGPGRNSRGGRALEIKRGAESARTLALSRRYSHLSVLDSCANNRVRRPSVFGAGFHAAAIAASAVRRRR